MHFNIFIDFILITLSFFVLFNRYYFIILFNNEYIGFSRISLIIKSLMSIFTCYFFICITATYFQYLILCFRLPKKQRNEAIFLLQSVYSQNSSACFQIYSLFVFSLLVPVSQFSSCSLFTCTPSLQSFTDLKRTVEFSIRFSTFHFISSSSLHSMKESQ